MKKLLFLSFLASCSAYTQTNAQAPFPTMDSITVNNIRATVSLHGDMWRTTPLLGYSDPSVGCYFADSTHESLNTVGSLWMSGYDGAGQLHIAAQTYRQDGNDYWPGPLDASGNLTYATSDNWAKIWKVNRSDIQYFQALPVHTISNTPAMILTWPGKGNTNAQGNGGAILTITTDMAPFVDLNHNGIYEPLLGEYPDISGDQALWWVFSDNGPTHTQSNGKPLQVEVHAMAYGYNRGTLIDNVVYYDYTLINRSANNYNNFRIAQWDDVEIGSYYLDDFIGFDSVWRMGIGYNGTNCERCDAGEPPSDYTIPQSAVTMIVLPGDAGTSYVPAGSFTYYNYDNSTIGNPAVDTEYDNYMRSKLRDGEHFTNDFAGAGVPSKGFGSGPDCNYLFTGDPGNNTQWSECNCDNNAGDARFILSSNNFTLNSGSSQHVVMALIAADKTGGCPQTSFDSIKIVADTAWGVYFNPPPPKPTGIANVYAESAVKIYPNPAHDQLVIENTGNNTGDVSVIVYNFLGQKIPVTINDKDKQQIADISGLVPGLYNVLYRNGNVQTSVQFVKK